MRKRAISRGIMLVAGLIAVCAILQGPSFSEVKKTKSDSSETVLVQAPSEAIPGSAVKIDEPSIQLLAQIEEQEAKLVRPIVRSEKIARYLKVLFRTLIAPNAP